MVIVSHSLEGGIIAVAVLPEKDVESFVDCLESFFIGFCGFQLVEILVVKTFSGGDFSHFFIFFFEFCDVDSEGIFFF